MEKDLDESAKKVLEAVRKWDMESNNNLGKLLKPKIDELLEFGKKYGSNPELLTHVISDLEFLVNLESYLMNTN